MEQLTDGQTSIEGSQETEVASSANTAKKGKRKSKPPVKKTVTEAMVPLPDERSLVQVKRELLAESSLPEASYSFPSQGGVKVGGTRKSKKQKPAADLVPQKKRRQGQQQSQKKAGGADKDSQGTINKKRTRKPGKAIGVEFLKKLKRSPEKRKVTVVSKHVEGQQNPTKTMKWTREETLDLLKALEQYGVTNWTDILKAVPTKSRKQIENYYKNLKAKHGSKKIFQKAPIEHWLQAAEATTMFDYDYSAILPQIISMAGYLEPHDPPRAKVASDPNWTKIYQYLANLMEQEEVANPQSLSPIEAAVMLDLLQNLSDHLNSLNTTKQREVMNKKYEQILQNTVMLKKTKEEEALYHGLDKDPLVETVPPYIPVNERGSTSDTQQCSLLKKSKLFSINPFSIPVKYLRPGPVNP